MILGDGIIESETLGAVSHETGRYPVPVDGKFPIDHGDAIH